MITYFQTMAAVALSIAGGVVIGFWAGLAYPREAQNGDFEP